MRQLNDYLESLIEALVSVSTVKSDPACNRSLACISVSALRQTNGRQHVAVCFTQ